MNFVKKFSSVSIEFGSEARNQLKNGVSLLAKCTNSTLGPKGRNVAIEYELGLPKITKDGVTVAKNIFANNKIQNIGCNIMKKAAHETNESAGDGTTTSILLGECILKEGFKVIKNGMNPASFKRGLEKSKNAMIEFLSEIKINISTLDDLKKVALVSTNYDEKLASLASKAIDHAGLYGVVHLEPSLIKENELVLTDGSVINRGFASNEFCQKKKKWRVDYDYPYILVANKSIQKTKEISAILDQVKALKQPFFIIANDLSKDLISNLVYNNNKDILEVCAITVPGFGEFTTQLLEDISLLTGSYLFSTNSEIDLSNAKIEHLGKCMKLFCSQEETFIIGNNGKSDIIQQKIKLLNDNLKKSTKMSQSARTLLLDRISRLSQKVAFIRTGGKTDIEINETRDKIIDSLNAVKSALEFGVLPGGGAALFHASYVLDFLEADDVDEKIGIEVVKNAVRLPIISLAENAGLNGKFMLEKMKEIKKVEKSNYIGFNHLTNKFEDMIAAGVIDSFSAVKSSLQDAISVSSLILSTEAVIAKQKSYTAPRLETYRKDIFQAKKKRAKDVLLQLQHYVYVNRLELQKNF